MQITAQTVSQLREQTGAGMMECKKALVESEGDIDRARDILRTRGKAGAEKRAGRATAEGVVAAAESDSAVALIELNSETDFVARNEAFRGLAVELATAAAAQPIDSAQDMLTSDATLQRKLDDVLTALRENIVFRRAVRFERAADSVLAAYIHRVTHKIGVLLELQGDPNSEDHNALARNIAMHIAASKPAYVSRDDVSADRVEHERQVLAELTRNEGKPEAAIPKIVEGRLSKFYEGVCLVDQPFVRDPSVKVGQLLADANASARRFVLFVVGQE